MLYIQAHVGIQYLFTSGVSTLSVPHFVSIFSLIPAPDSLPHQSSHLLVVPTTVPVHKLWFGDSYGLRTYQEAYEVKPS